MFKATIKSNQLSEAIGAIRAITDEAKFQITADGISVKAVDHANVAMINLDLSKEASSFFDASEHALGIDVAKLENQVLGSAEKDSDITLELDEAAHKLLIKLNRMSYTMSLLDPSSIRKEPIVPNLDLPLRATIPGEEFKRAIKAAGNVSDYLTLGYDTCLFANAWDDTGSLRVEFAEAEGVAPMQVQSLFSLSYMSNFAAVIGKAEKVTLHIGKDMPLRMQFNIADGHGEVGYLMAPRVESE